MVFRYKAEKAGNLKDLNGIKIGNRFFGRASPIDGGAREFSFFHNIGNGPTRNSHWGKIAYTLGGIVIGVAIGNFIWNQKNEIAEKPGVPQVTYSSNNMATRATGTGSPLPSPLELNKKQAEELAIVKINVPADTAAVTSIDTGKGIVYLEPKYVFRAQPIPDAIVTKRTETQIKVVEKPLSFTDNELNAALQWVSQRLQLHYGIFGLKHGQRMDISEDKDFSAKIVYMLNPRTFVLLEGGTNSQSFFSPDGIPRKGRTLGGQVGVYSKVYELLNNNASINIGISGHYSTGFTGNKLSRVISTNLGEFGMSVCLLGQYNLSESTILQGGVIVSSSNLQRVLDKTIGTGVITKLKTPAGDIYPSLEIGLTLPMHDSKLKIDRPFTGNLNSGLTLRNGQLGFGFENSAYFEDNGHPHLFNPSVSVLLTINNQ